MVNNRFEAYKLKRELKYSGTLFTFKRKQRNEFNELDGEPVEIGKILGLYHETNSQITTTIGDGAVTRTKKQPALLCLVDDYLKLGLNFGDVVSISDEAANSHKRTLKYIGCVDIMNWGIIADLSFEVIDDGD